MNWGQSEKVERYGMNGMRNDKSNGKNRWYHIIYAVMAVFFLFMIVWTAVKNEGSSPAELLSEGNAAFDEGWRLADGSEADMKHLHKMAAVQPYQEQSVYHDLPDDLGEGKSLCFRTTNIFYQVYVDGELRFEPKMRESSVYNRSPGTRWTYVPLCSEDAGRSVEIRFYTVYRNANACVDHLMLGCAAGEILGTLTERTVAFVICILLMFSGLLLIIADIPANMQKDKSHELLYLGLFAISVALWCLTETDLLQFYTDDSRILQILSCYSLMIIPVPLALYMDAAFEFKKRRVVPALCGLSAAEFVLCAVLHFTGIMDYHDTLTFSHVVMAVSAVVLLCSIVRDMRSARGNGRKNTYKVIRTVGLVSLCLTTGIDAVRYYSGRNSDTALFVRIGLLIFILCYGGASLERVMDAVQLGMQAEFVSHLAYQDGLTGVGNRTAFKERLEELEGKKTEIPGIGILMFDVNDLKYVNDNLGHQNGDNLIVGCADIIKSVLEQEGGACFRVGGDEFAGIIVDEDASGKCEAAMEVFRDVLSYYNMVPDQTIRISVAGGYAVYDRTRDKRLMDVYRQADACMYENKKQIKSTQIPPEEFYARKQ